MLNGSDLISTDKGGNHLTKSHVPRGVCVCSQGAQGLPATPAAFTAPTRCECLAVMPGCAWPPTRSTGPNLLRDGSMQTANPTLSGSVGWGTPGTKLTTGRLARGKDKLDHVHREFTGKRNSNGQLEFGAYIPS